MLHTRGLKMTKHSYHLQGSYSDDVGSLISFCFGHFHRFLQNFGLEKRPRR